MRPKSASTGCSWQHDLCRISTMASHPDYLICLNCETPTYTFEWVEGEVVEVFCTACGADVPDEFMSEDEYEGMISAGH